MIDFYRKSALSQLGKDAGNQSIPEYVRNIGSKYDLILSKIEKQKANPVANKNDNFELYL